VTDAAAAPRLAVSDAAGAAVMTFTGPLDVDHAGPLWADAIAAASHARPRPLVFDIAGLTGLDTAGVTLLLAAERAHGQPARVDGATPQLAELIGRIRAVVESAAPPRAPDPSPTVREMFASGLTAATEGLAFLGEAAVALLRLPINHRMLRAADFWHIADEAGVRAVPLVLLLGVLIGLILAFQSVIPLRAYGADLYVANLVGISLTRELGPLLAAVILAGRTGSAFAAEIGTMQVNQEIDALKTMALDPMTILMMPRLAAAALVMPALTTLLVIAGLIGMVIVLNTFGFSTVAIANQVASAVTVHDLFSGLFKGFMFGAVIAAIGCKAGLSTGVGPRAVGISATAAVVGGIVATIVLDGVFAVLFYRIGI
jgi:phospholipid/cholesterol/gamma-HCH transport system permease protein